ncbi:MAG TPA: phosphodiester glycosidase family protein [Candidatus Aquilonibacter sp.]
MRRTQFIVGLGVFAAANMTWTRSALSQVPGPVSLGSQGALYQFSLKGDGVTSDCLAAVLPQSAFEARILSNRLRPSDNAIVADLAQETGAVVGINGGFYSMAGGPDGLLILDGKRIGYARSDWKGYFSIDGTGAASIGTDVQPTVPYAMQGYPMLIEPGGVMGIRSNDHIQARRSVIAQSGSTIVAMVVSQISLFELASFLMQNPSAFGLTHFDAALNLSGSATSGFYAKMPHGKSVNVQAQASSRDVIAFYNKAAPAASASP